MSDQTWAERVEREFYSWSNGLDTMDAPEAGHFEDWYQSISERRRAGDEDGATALATEAITETLRWLHYSDHDAWLGLWAERPSSVPAVKCEDCSRDHPHRHCPECGDIGHSAAHCDMEG